MSIAELGGKLAPDRPYGCHDRMEDLLTSDVFGTMRYAGWSCGFLDWLREAKPAPVQAQPEPVLELAVKSIDQILPSSGILAVHHAFWPSLPNRREADLALLFHIEAGVSVLVLIEVKYLSGTSDFDIPDEGDELERTGNQIADQISGLSKLSPDDVCQWFKLDKAPMLTERVHLFITKDSLLPISVYSLARYNLARSSLPPRLWPVNAYWLSWTSLARHLEPHKYDLDAGRAALIQDLYNLLIRKELVPYHGFELKPCNRLSIDPAFWQDIWWRFAPIGIASLSTFWQATFWNFPRISLPSRFTFWEG
jgi:hypothetical protein